MVLTCSKLKPRFAPRRAYPEFGETIVTYNLKFRTIAVLLAATAPFAAIAEDGPIIHDAEYRIIERQHGDRWAAEDTEIDTKLAEIRERNGGKPPNILYILLDDVGFGEIGTPDLDVIRGYSTPNIASFAEEGMFMARMYTEPSCTPTRVAMMTGRHPGPDRV